MTVDLAALAARIEPPSEAARSQARERQDRLTKPAGALGQLEELSVWLAGVQGACPTRPIKRPSLVVFAADHGVAAAGVSAYPSAVTAQMVRTLVSGRAAANVLARLVGARVRVLDLAVDVDLCDLPAGVGRHKVRRGSGRLDRTDALTGAEAERAFHAGLVVADQEIDAGADLLVPGDLGIGNSTVAAVLIGALTGADAASVTGRGTGIDDATWRHKRDIVAAGLRRARPVAADPLGLLATVGGADVAAMTAFVLRAAIRRTPVVLDGIVSGAAALVAASAAPAAVAWWAAGHRSPEPAHGLALQRLELSPILDLGLRLGEGTGALLALPLLGAAGATLAEMATFAEAGVADRVGYPADHG